MEGKKEFYRKVDYLLTNEDGFHIYFQKGLINDRYW